MVVQLKYHFLAAQFGQSQDFGDQPMAEREIRIRLDHEPNCAGSADRPQSRGTVLKPALLADTELRKQ